MRRRHLRTRVLLLTGAFTVALFGVAFGLSWRARQSQDRWTRILSIETRTITVLEELVRAQNGFMARRAAGGGAEGYRIVEQLLSDDAGTEAVRNEVAAFRRLLETAPADSSRIAAASARVIDAAQNEITTRRHEIARQLPALERETRAMMSSGLAVAWIIALLSFAAVQTTLRKVVTPIEELSSAADRIAAGDLAARAPVAGDLEIATLGVAFNRMADELKSRARTDDLTALPNFRAFSERIDLELDRVERYPAPLGVMLLDLDRFKAYNDTWGHPAGNEALKRVSAVLRETVRSVDFPARYGGEEFAVILPQVDAEALAAIAERVRANVEALPAPPDGATVTVSIGIALHPLEAKDRTSLLQLADERLYAAKKAGRNRVAGVTGAGPATRSVAPRSA